MTDEPVTIFITGTAGAGKSSFSQSFGVWLNNNNYDSTIVNMDPGASDDESSSFDIDIREWIDIAQVMEKYKLGVNGAQIVAADLITLHINEIKEEIDKIKGAYTIIDTPGQIELFYLRESGQVVIDSLGNKRSVICFLYDPFISASPSIFMSLRTMALLMEFRFSIPMINILSKSDLISDKKNEKVREWMMNSNMLFEDMSIESPSMNREMAMNLLKLFDELDISSTIIPTSSKNYTGMDVIYGLIQELFHAGEDLEKI